MTKMAAHQNSHAQPKGSSPVTVYFAKFAQATAVWTGHPAAFLLALAVVLVWIVTGPVFDYSDTWQLVINTGTTIVTFLMVFLIQNTQNRDMMAVQLKLPELVLAMKGAENKFASIEDLTDEELKALHDECRARIDMTSVQLARRTEGQFGNDTQKPRAAARRTMSHRRTAKPAH